MQARRGRSETRVPTQDGKQPDTGEALKTGGRKIILRFF